jgi:hypothetical protein
MKGGEQMKDFIMYAELNGDITSLPIKARSKEFAIALAARESSIRCVHDKRFEKGQITIKDPFGRVFYRIKAGSFEGEIIPVKKEEEDTE